MLIFQLYSYYECKNVADKMIAHAYPNLNINTSAPHILPQIPNDMNYSHVAACRYCFCANGVSLTSWCQIHENKRETDQLFRLKVILPLRSTQLTFITTYQLVMKVCISSF